MEILDLKMKMTILLWVESLVKVEGVVVVKSKQASKEETSGRENDEKTKGPPMMSFCWYYHSKLVARYKSVCNTVCVCEFKSILSLWHTKKERVFLLRFCETRQCFSPLWRVAEVCGLLLLSFFWFVLNCVALTLL